MGQRLATAILYLFFWGFFFYASFNFFVHELPSLGIHRQQSHIFAYTVAYVALMAGYPGLYWAFIRPLAKKRAYWGYAAALVASYAAALYAIAGLDDLFLRPDHPDWLYTPAHVLSRLPYLVCFTIIATLINMRKAYFKQKNDALALEKLKAEAELRWLKAQINPHFLFNTLNNINSQIHMAPKAAAEMVVALSGLLRYVVYEGAHDRVPLRQEVAHIQNYLGLATRKRAMAGKVAFTHRCGQGAMVAPLIFINFIENALKHGAYHHADSRLAVSLTADGDTVTFTCANPYAPQPRQDAGGGIGLANIKKRLALAYPSRHRLQVGAQGGVYRVHLTLWAP